MLGLDRLGLLADPARPLSAAELSRFQALVERRAERRPLAQVLGRREFWSRDFLVGEATLDPRPDTETLVEAVLDRVDRAGAPAILDLGTGTGCILVTLLAEIPAARGLGVDRSPATAAIAARNARRHGTGTRATFIVADWASPIAGAFDIVVSNPPYIPDGDITGLAPEVSRFEPRLALAGGPDGLDAYRRIAESFPRLLRAGGLVALEVGAGQAADVAALLAEASLGQIERIRDLGGVERVVLARKSL